MTAFNIKVGETSFAAESADSPAARELPDLLPETKLAIQMQDHGGFEKSGNWEGAWPQTTRRSRRLPGTS
jgi:hypothetical protein